MAALVGAHKATLVAKVRSFRQTTALKAGLFSRIVVKEWLFSYLEAYFYLLGLDDWAG